MATGLSWWKRFRQHRCVEGLVIPPEARVDPSRFPEAEFPLQCPQCDYLLRGLPECRCPECGRPFDRGRLLVEQYVIEEGRWHVGGVGRWSRWLFAVGFVLAIGPIAIHLVLMLVGRTGLLPFKFVLPTGKEWMPLVGMAPGFLLVLVATILRVHAKFSTLTKCRKVLKAIDVSDPAIRRAQMFKPFSLRVLATLVFLAYALAIVLELAIRPEAHRRDPLRLLAIAMLVAVIIFGMVFAGAVVLHRSQERCEEPDRWGG